MPRSPTKTLTLAAVTAALVATTAAPLAAQLSVGPQLSYGTKSDLGAGVRAFAPLPTPRPAQLIAAADYFFGDERPGRDVTWIELTGGAGVTLGMDTAWEGDAWAGLAGTLSLVTEEEQGVAGTADTDVFPGLALSAGWQARTANFTSFVEVRAVFGAAGQLVFSAGLLFGGAGPANR